MFLSKAELTTHLYEGVMDAISEGDDAKVNAAIKAAVSEAKGYLGRYDTDALFAGPPVPAEPDPENPEPGPEPEDLRDPILLMYAKDMAVWHFIVLANPNVDLELRQRRYEAAISWLGKVQAGKIVMQWPLRQPEAKLTYFQFGGNSRRGSHY